MKTLTEQRLLLAPGFRGVHFLTPLLLGNRETEEHVQSLRCCRAAQLLVDRSQRDQGRPSGEGEVTLPKAPTPASLIAANSWELSAHLPSAGAFHEQTVRATVMLEN